MPTPARLVTLGTLGLAAVAAGYVLRFGSDLPNADEWDFAHAVVGPFPWAWLIEHHNEHRYPLGRLAWATTARLSGDFRGPMLLTVGLLAAASWLLTDAARRRRGVASVGDLVVPALLLNWGHGFALLMGYQTAFGLFALGLAGAAWAAVARRPHLGGLFAAAAVQSGGFGLAVAGPLAAWLAWEGVRGRRAVLVWPATLIGYAVWAAATMPPSVRPPDAGSPAAGGASYLAVGLGMWVGPVGRPAWWVAVGVAGGVYLAACFALASDATRPDALGLAAVLGGGLLAAAAVGYGRGELALADRFVTPAAAGLAVAWVVMRVRRRAWVGLPLAVGLVAVNVGPGERYGRLFRHDGRAFAADMAAGLPPVFLAGKYGGGLPFLVGERVGVGVATLRDGGWKRFRDVPADPPFTPVPVRDGLPVRLASGNEPFVPGGPPPPAVPLGASPGPAVGLRVRGEQHFPMGYQRLRLRWTDAAGVARVAEATPKVVPGAFTVVFPVGGPATDVRLEAGCPMLGLDVQAAEWLVPPG